MARVIAVCNAKGGVGKCLAPETPVLLANGEILSIEKIFERYAPADDAPKMLDEDGGFFVQPGAPLEVLSWNDDLNVESASVSALYRGRADKLFEVTSSKGKTVRVTARHPFLIMRHGAPTWIRADELEEGDFIATPRRAPVVADANATDLLPRFSELLYVRMKDKDFIASHLAEILESSNDQLSDRILWKLFQEEGMGAEQLYAIANKAVIFKHLKILLKRGVVEREQKKHSKEFYYRLNGAVATDYIFERGFSSKLLLQYGWPRGFVKEMYYLNRSAHACLPMNPIFHLDEPLAKFVSLLLAEGYLGASRAIFFNASPELITCFTGYCETLGLPYRTKDLGTYSQVTIDGAGTLMKFLGDVFEVPVYGKRKSSRVNVPSVILQAPQEILAAYLGAYIDCEGYIAKDRSTIQISSASESNIMKLHYAFLRFGINGSLRTVSNRATNSPNPKWRPYYILNITGAPYAQAILDNIPVVISKKRERLEKAAARPSNTNVDVVPLNGLIRTARQDFGLAQGEIGVQGTITDYEDGSVVPSREAARGVAVAMLKKASSLAIATANPAVSELVRLAFADVFWERVSAIRVSAYDGYVYDLTVKRNHNFAAGNGAFIVHNTTTSVNIAAYLAAAGKRTLLVDFDPQANASSALGFPAITNDVSVYHAVIGAVEHENIVKQTVLYNLQLIPSAPHLAGALVEFVDMPEREYFLRKFINRVRHQYDYIIIDLPPSLSLLTVNGLVAADEVLIPVQAEYYSLEGLGQLLETVNLIRENLQHPLRVTGAFITMFDKREHLSREVAKNLRANFPYHVFEVEIPRAVALAEAPSFSKPIILYDPNSPGAWGYRRLTNEIIDQEKILFAPAQSAATADEAFGNFNVAQ